MEDHLAETIRGFPHLRVLDVQQSGLLPRAEATPTPRHPDEQKTALELACVDCPNLQVVAFTPEYRWNKKQRQGWTVEINDDVYYG